MVVFKLILLVWLICGTALHIYTLHISEKEGDGYEEQIDNICRAHGVPLIIGAISSYVFTVIVGVPFIAYKFVKHLVGC